MIGLVPSKDEDEGEDEDEDKVLLLLLHSEALMTMLSELAENW
jgi:hypothetical protein